MLSKFYKLVTNSVVCCSHEEHHQKSVTLKLPSVKLTHYWLIKLDYRHIYVKLLAK